MGLECKPNRQGSGDLGTFLQSHHRWRYVPCVVGAEGLWVWGRRGTPRSLGQTSWVQFPTAPAVSGGQVFVSVAKSPKGRGGQATVTWDPQ